MTDTSSLLDETALRWFITDVAVIRGALAQTVPEHPKKENVFAISTAVGDVFLFQASSTFTDLRYTCVQAFKPNVIVV